MEILFALVSIRVTIINAENCCSRNIHPGPDEISIRSPSAMAEISSKCTKAPFHDLLLPRTSIITTRNKTLHDQRRRIGDQGFGAKALNKYEPQVDHSISLLTYAISQRLGTPLDVASWFHHFSFDLMGRLSFGKSFNMLATGKRHFAIDLMRDGMTLLGLFTPTPWLARIGVSIPGVASGWKSMSVWSDAQMPQRIDRPPNPTAKSPTSPPDSSTPPAKPTPSNPTAAGSTATPPAPSSQPQTQPPQPSPCSRPLPRPRRENPHPSSEPGRPTPRLPFPPQRRHQRNPSPPRPPSPPTPPANPRPKASPSPPPSSPPGNTALRLPLSSLHRLPSCFSRPGDLIPERWSRNRTGPRARLDKAAFAPFSQGRFGCVGERLALMEIRAVAAARFDFRFAGGRGSGSGSGVIGDYLYYDGWGGGVAVYGEGE